MCEINMQKIGIRRVFQVIPIDLSEHTTPSDKTKLSPNPRVFFNIQQLDHKERAYPGTVQNGLSATYHRYNPVESWILMGLHSP